MSHHVTSFDLLFFAIGDQAFKMGNGGAGDDVYKLIEQQMEANRARAQFPYLSAYELHPTADLHVSLEKG